MTTQALLSEDFARLHPEDAARVLERLAPPHAAAFLAGATPSIAAAVLGRMAPDTSMHCLAGMPPDHSAAVLGQMERPMAANLLRRMEREPVKAILAELPKKIAGAMSRLLQFPDGSAGALMDPLAPTYPVDMDVGTVLNRLRASAGRDIRHVYVVDRSHVLKGHARIIDIAVSDLSLTIENIMRSGTPVLAGNMSRRVALASQGWRNFHELPVVDAKGRLLGAVTIHSLRAGKPANGAGKRTGTAGGAVIALGELYWAGLAEMARLAADAMGGESEERP